MKTVTKFLLLILLLSHIYSCKEDRKEDDNAPKLHGEEVVYHADSTALKGYLVYDESTDKKRPGIIVIHEWWGLNDYVRQRADMLAALGYTAMAVDMYGNGKQAYHPDDAGKFALTVMKNMDMAKDRFNAGLQLLKNHPTVEPSKIAAIGYCFGGSMVLTMANSGADLDAVAAFHSGVELPVMPNSDLIAKVLVCNGGADPFISEESVKTFKRQMDSIHADYKYVTYPGSKHGFTNKAADSLGKAFDLPLEYNQEAEAKSWEELLALLKSVF